MDFVSKSSIVHNNFYDYSKVCYVNNKTKVIIICPFHGEFEQKPHNHLSLKQGCPQCGVSKMKRSKSLNSDLFILKAKNVHGDKYDYSKVIYCKNNIKVNIICKIHGEFAQKPEHHLRESDCPRCARKNNSKLENEWLSLFNISNQYRQFKIKINDLTYKVDGFDPNTHTVYEFYGDFWHGNPERFNHSDTNMIVHKTFGELYNQTFAKENNLRSAGYQIVSIWESDYLKIRKLI